MNTLLSLELGENLWFSTFFWGRSGFAVTDARCVARRMGGGLW